MVDVVNGADEINKGARGDFDDVANTKRGLVFWFVFGGSFDNLVNFGLGNRGGFIFDTNKTGNSGGGADGDPGIVVEDHLDEDITGESFFLGFDFLATANGHFRLDGDDGLEDAILKTHGFESGFESIDDFIFVTRVSVDDVPGGVDGWFTIRKLELEFFFVGEGRGFGHKLFFNWSSGWGGDSGGKDFNLFNCWFLKIFGIA